MPVHDVTVHLPLLLGLRSSCMRQQPPVLEDGLLLGDLERQLQGSSKGLRRVDITTYYASDAIYAKQCIPRNKN